MPSRANTSFGFNGGAGLPVFTLVAGVSKEVLPERSERTGLWIQVYASAPSPVYLQFGKDAALEDGFELQPGTAQLFENHTRNESVNLWCVGIAKGVTDERVGEE